MKKLLKYFFDLDDFFNQIQQESYLTTEICMKFYFQKEIKKINNLKDLVIKLIGNINSNIISNNEALNLSNNYLDNVNELILENNKRKYFNISDDLLNIKSKLLEIVTELQKSNNLNTKVKNINNLRKIKITRDNHIIFKSYFKKWDKVKININENFTYNIHNQFLYLPKNKKIFKTKILNLSQNLDKFMMLTDCFEQKLEDFFTNYEIENEIINTEVIYKLEKLNDYINRHSKHQKNEIDLYFHINKDTVPFSLYSNSVSQFNSNNKLIYNKELIHLLQIKKTKNDNSLINQLNIFFGFLLARNEFAKIFCKFNIIKKDKEFKLQSNKINSFEQTFIIINMLNNNHKFKKTSAFINELLDNKFTIEKFMDLLLFYQQQAKEFEKYYKSLNLKNSLLDNELSTKISSLFMEDFIEIYQKEIFSDYLVFTTKTELNTTCYPLLKNYLGNDYYFILAYSPKILIINGSKSIIEKLKKQNVDDLAKNYNNLIKKTNFVIKK